MDFVCCVHIERAQHETISVDGVSVASVWFSINVKVKFWANGFSVFHQFQLNGDSYHNVIRKSAYKCASHRHVNTVRYKEKELSSSMQTARVSIFEIKWNEMCVCVCAHFYLWKLSSTSLHIIELDVIENLVNACVGNYVMKKEAIWRLVALCTHTQCTSIDCIFEAKPNKKKKNKPILERFIRLHSFTFTRKKKLKSGFVIFSSLCLHFNTSSIYSFGVLCSLFFALYLIHAHVHCSIWFGLVCFYFLWLFVVIVVQLPLFPYLLSFFLLQTVLFSFTFGWEFSFRLNTLHVNVNLCV